MNEIALDELSFFDNQMPAFELYNVLRKTITDLFPNTDIQIRKTQINFKSKHIFACVSFLRVLKKTELPNPYIVLTLGLPYCLESERAAAITEPYPGRWTTHFVIGNANEIDNELLEWLSDAYSFANLK